MRSATSRGIAAATAVFASAALAIGTGGVAHAATTPPWELDPAATGTISFYNAAGTVITSGSVDDAPLAAYAVASAPVHAGDTKAILDAAQPNPLTNPPLNWNKDQLSAATAFPITTGPTAIKNMTNPVVTGASGDLTLADFIAEFPNTGPTGIGCAYAATPAGCTNAAYEDIYQLRLKTLDSGGFQSSGYAVADVLVSGTTWTQIYPSVATGAPTTTTLSVTPATSASQGDSVTLTATTALQSDATSHPAGSVQFKDNGTNVGAAVPVDGSGVATLMTTALPASAPSGASLTATFTPTDTADAPSTSAAVAYTVNPVAAKPTITGSVKVGSTVTCTEDTTSAETVSYAWDVGTKQVATSKKFAIPASSYKKSLTCTVTVKAGDGPSSSATSDSQKVAVGAALKAKKDPKLSGKGKVGAKEKVKPGKWSPKASSYSYQWFDGKKKIKVRPSLP